MTDTGKEAFETIRALLESQTLAVLSTQKNGQPYASLVAFAATADLEQILFLTPKTTRKYDHLITNPRVAVLINNSMNQAEDIYKAVSVTAIGRAQPVEEGQKEELMALFLARHPHLKAFSDSPTTALICIQMDRYFMVNQFQNVTEFQVGS